ncbi:MAG TPA: AAA family ATPase [Acidimicrobiales bacterium]
MTDLARAELEAEQAHVDRAYTRLEELRVAAERLARQALADDPGGHGQMFLDREELIHSQERRLADLHVGDDQPLVFGRMDFDSYDSDAAGDENDSRVGPMSHHIGRIGVHDADHEPLVVDWRAPIAESFYRATAADPMGLVRRRHLICRGRRVLALDDELLDGVAAEDAGLLLVGEAALLAAVDRERTGRMSDIVATIQAEQDLIVRSQLAGVHVVQGGPGTGKTAVALHRVAYLLYTHRLQLQDHGVLVVGPSPLFLRYVERVLPSLGEEAVTMATLAGLVPPTRTTGHDTPAVARVKGSPEMATLLANAVSDRERPLSRVIGIPYGGHVLRLTPGMTRSIVDRVRRRRGTHNERRASVERSIHTTLFRIWAKRMAKAQSGHDDGEQGGGAHSSTADRLSDPAFRNEARDDMVAAIRRTPEYREVLERIWPLLTPHELLHDLFGSRALLRSATPDGLTSDDVARLHRERSASASRVRWTIEDIPLIDEAQVLVGDMPRARRQEDADGWTDFNMSQLADDLDAASEFADRELALVRDSRWDVYEEEEELTPWTRTWAHVVVDEAQELAPMAWRMLARRCPRASMTIVGDLGQASSPLAPSRWSDIDAHLPGRYDLEIRELTINYRTPADIMSLAAKVLAEVAPDLTPPRSVRPTGRGIDVVPSRPDTLASSVASIVGDAEAGTVAVIAPPSLLGSLSEALEVEADPADLLDRRVVLLSPETAKGLEFDDVVVVEPALIASGDGPGDDPTPAGMRTLYVSMTRPTQRLALVHALPLPPVLRGAR